MAEQLIDESAHDGGQGKRERGSGDDGLQDLRTCEDRVTRNDILPLV